MFNAYKKIGPCLDSGALVSDGETAPGGTDASEACALGQELGADKMATARAVSEDLAAIVAKWDGKGDEPVSDMATLAELVAWMRRLPSRAREVDFSVDKSFNVSNPACKYARSLIMFGGPLLGGFNAEPFLNYSNIYEFRDQQARTVVAWLRSGSSQSGWRLDRDGNGRVSEEEVEAYTASRQDGQKSDAASAWNILNTLREASYVSSFSDSLTLHFLMTELLFDVFVRVLLADVALIYMANIFIFLYLWIGTNSYLIAVVGVYQINLSVPLAWIIYRDILQIKYFSVMNLLMIFVVCAIGADDLFIFMDAYTLSEFEGPRVMKRKYRPGRRAHGDFTCKTPRAAFLNFTTRMDWVYRRSGLAMFITTSTTCLAFLCLLFTPLPGPRSFGIFGELPRHRLPQHLILTPLPRFRTRHQHGTFAPSL